MTCIHFGGPVLRCGRDGSPAWSNIADWKFHGGDLTAGPKAARAWLESQAVGAPVIDGGMQRTAQLRDTLFAAGFVAGVDLLHQVGQGDGHNEEAWRRRLPQALAFLLPP